MISIIIPFKDAAEYLPRCISSLLIQPGDFEFILVNDDSKDDGPEIVETYRNYDDRVRHLDNDGLHNDGVSGARNVGLDAARGEWITFLDADDEMLPDAYNTFTNELKRVAGANMYQFNHLRYYTTINKLALKYANEAGTYKIPKLPVHWFGVWNKLFKAEFIQDIRFDESLQYGEDGLFILDCLRKEGTIIHAPKNRTTVKHRFDNKNSLSHVKTIEDIQRQIKSYEGLLKPEVSREYYSLVCTELAVLWNRIATELK